MLARMALVLVLGQLAGCHLVAAYTSEAVDQGRSRDAPSSDASAPNDSLTDVLPHDGLDSGNDGNGDPTVCDDGLLGVVFCDGYEDPSFEVWVKDVAFGFVTQDTLRAFRGRGALNAAITSGGGVATLTATQNGPLNSGDLYARAYFYVPASTQLQDVALMIVGEDQAPWDHVAFSVGDLDTPVIWVEEIRKVTVSSIPLPLDRWVCVQVHIDISDTNGTVELFIDNALAARLTGVDTLPARGYRDISAGLPWTNDTNPAAEVWVDELVLATAPIPCDS